MNAMLPQRPGRVQMQVEMQPDWLGCIKFTLLRGRAWREFAEGFAIAPLSGARSIAPRKPTGGACSARRKVRYDFGPLPLVWFIL
jgi:hypothetical protein